ncbi:MAG: HAD hydrolase-like protein, partial [Muribaculaceae bacterium]|nr:HAD hydrolase-like protein [Muribaculaceae bacterium]
MATVCFDLDDTLYREWDFVASGYRSVAALLAADSDPADAARYLELISARRPVGFEAAIDELYPAINGRPCPYTVDALIEHYRAHTPDISLRPGVADMLCAIADAGHRLMLITDGSTRHQRSKIRALGLTRFFAPDDILISAETGGDKTTTVPWAAVERTARRSTGTNSRSDLWY